MKRTLKFFMDEETIIMKDLIYWIDKEFVQARAISLFGREFSADEMIQVTKYIDSGLAFSVFEIIDIALREVDSSEIK